MDIKKQNDGKIHLSVPCVYCKNTHGYNVGSELILRDELTKLSCPFSGMSIAFVGDGESVTEELDKSAEELSRIMMALEAESISDIQPQDVTEDECPPDPAIYDTINFLVRDLEAEGKVTCPCGDGKYELRFCDDGMQVYCEKCGAVYTFHSRSASLAEEYLSIDSIELK